MWTKYSTLIGCLLIQIYSVKGRATISSNGYSDLVVAISPDTPENGDIVDQIKLLVTEASRELYIATRNRAYFKKVKILLPKTWTEYEADVVKEDETYEAAEIRVDSPNSLYDDTPYTLTSGSCGVSGSFIHLTPTFLEGGTSVYGNWGKVLVHEWAKLRWGVFEEHGYPGDTSFPMFFYKTTWTVSGQRNELTPNFCVNSPLIGYQQDLVSGGSCNYNDDLLPDHNCYYYATQETKASSSYMALPYLSSNTQFCDDGEEFIHNPDLPNRHNFYCEGRSTWDVITSSQDFAGGANPEDPAIYNTEPEFVIVGSASEHPSYVLVLDVSLSMRPPGNTNKADRITVMLESAKRWVKYELLDNVNLGIVIFSEEGKAIPIQDLVGVTEETRDQIVSTIHSIYEEKGSRTCIGCGLNMAANYTGLLGDKRGNTIVLITDGVQLCFSPDSEECIGVLEGIDDLVERNIRVITIALGPDADPDIELLTEKTGGKAFYVQDNSGSGGMNDAFTGSTTYQPGDTISNTDINVYQRDWNTDFSAIIGGEESQFAGKFEIDSSLGRDLVVQLEIHLPTEGSESVCVEDLLLILVAPDDDHTGYKRNFTCTTDNFGILRLDLTELEPPVLTGLWVYRITIKESIRVTVSVTGKAKDASTDPILTECWIQKEEPSTDNADIRLAVRAEVRQGNKPVLGAQVTALVERPSEVEGEVLAPMELELKDNGCGADTVKNDGAYTRYFTKYTGMGRYSVRCQVVGDNNTQVNQGFTAARKSRVLPGEPGPRLCCGSDTVTPDTVLSPAGVFQRQAAAGSFQVTSDMDLTQDVTPPARVVDLTVTYRIGDEALILTFTAPGDDLDDEDPVMTYTIKYSLTSGNLSSSNFDDNEFNMDLHQDDLILGSSLDPVQGGETVTLKVDPSLFDRDSQYSFAMRATDESNNRSPVSNIGRGFLVTHLPLTESDNGSSSLTVTNVLILVISFFVFITL